MSSSRNVIIGAYLECVSELKTVKVRQLMCKNKHESQSFYCPKCGEKVRSVEIGEEQAAIVNSADLVDVIDDKLQCLYDLDLEEGVHIWKANWGVQKTVELYVDEYDAGITPLNPSDIPLMIQNFAESYAKEIEIFKKHYKTVDIRFGVINYWS